MSEQTDANEAAAKILESFRTVFDVFWARVTDIETFFNTDGAQVARALADAKETNRPDPLPFGVSPRGAEHYVGQWMSWLGFSDVRITPERRDGGFDLETDAFVVQVKNLNSGWVGVAPVREIHGVAQVYSKKALFFSRGFLSDDALEFATKANMPVFLFHPEEALLQPANVCAEEFLELRIATKVARNMAGMALAELVAVSQAWKVVAMSVLTLREYFEPAFLSQFASAIGEFEDSTLDPDSDELDQTMHQLVTSDLETATKEAILFLVRRDAELGKLRKFKDFLETSQGEISGAVSRYYAESIPRSPAAG